MLAANSARWMWCSAARRAAGSSRRGLTTMRCLPGARNLAPMSRTQGLRPFSSAKGEEDMEVSMSFDGPAPPGGAQMDPEMAKQRAEARAADDNMDPTPQVQGASKAHTYQAETSRILDIMANSLYTDKEVFLRELISNASDALEKARYLQQSGEVVDADKPFEIRIRTDEQANTITLQDYGVGMNEEELVSHLGTIARSGSKKFMSDIVEQGGSGEAVNNIIGQFGVGFYSCFMVADKVEVFSQSAQPKDGERQQAYYWSSDGSGTYELGEASEVVRGTKIVLHLKDDAKSFSIEHSVQGIIQKYSNFVGFPIYLNGVKLNTVQAVWTMDKNSVSEEQHTEFYRYIANAWDDPSFRLHFQTDAPISINALFYFPEKHMERFGMGRQDAGVSLYSRKVLISPKSEAILPGWLRFVKGVVDSEDIPLNISRENMQDSALITRINSVLTKRVLKFLEERARKEPEAFSVWWKEFGHFLKEGICSDFQHKDQIATLVRFESSSEAKAEITLDEYISRMPIEQKGIYYLNAPSREFALTSPYYETFDKDGVEVLFLYNQMDDFVMSNIGTYQGRKLINIESGKIDTAEEDAAKDADAGEDAEATKAKEAELVDFVKTTLSDKVTSVKTTRRLVSTPAIVVDHESASVRRMMAYVDQQSGTDIAKLPKQKLEINPDHSVMVKLMQVKDSQPELAKLVLEQVFDNALIAADILDNPRTMLNRLTSILDHTLEVNKKE